MRGVIERFAIAAFAIGLMLLTGATVESRAQTADKMPTATNNGQQTAPTGQTSAPSNTPSPTQPVTKPKKDDRTLETAKAIFDIFTKERARQKAKKQANQPAPVAVPPVAELPEPAPVSVPSPAPKATTPSDSKAIRPTPTTVKPTVPADSPTRVATPIQRATPPAAPKPLSPSPEVDVTLPTSPPPVETLPSSSSTSSIVTVSKPASDKGSYWMWIALAALATAIAAAAARIFLFPKPKYAFDIQSEHAVSRLPKLAVEAPDSRIDVHFEWGLATIPTIRTGI